MSKLDTKKVVGFTPEQLKRITKAAQLKGQNASTFIRTAALEASQKVEAAQR